MGIRLPKNGLRALWRDQSGATALITGVALLLIACAAMTVFDFGNVSSQRSKLQDMLDAATLAAARIGGDDDAAAVEAGQNYLKAHLPEGVYKNLDVDFIPGDKTVRATATAGVDPYFLNMFLDGPVAIGVESEVVRSVDGALEVALVLDTTKSMEGGGKLDALKKAAEALVKKITKVKDADVRIGVVPFSTYVNVGVKQQNQPWISGAEDRVVPKSCREVKSETSCTKWGAKKACTGYNDGIPYEYDCTPCVEKKTVTYDPPKEVCSSAKVTKWKGCVGSPAYPRNVQDNTTNIYPAQFPRDEDCPPELTPLTDKLGPVESAIKSLSARGNTYIPAGLAWGWNLLSPTAPFTEAAAYDPNNKKPRKALVLMTDGDNTLKPNATGSHVESRPSPMGDKYTAELCDNIKKQKIEIYTVGFQITNPVVHEMLLKCATSPGHYFKAESSEDLMKAFEAIGASLENLRISR